jgi:hypothetical protein
VRERAQLLSDGIGRRHAEISSQRRGDAIETASHPKGFSRRKAQRGGAATKRLGLRQDAKHHGQQNFTVSLPFLYQFFVSPW